MPVRVEITDEKDTAEAYGVSKAHCERIVQEQFGSEVLAPGKPDDPAQFVGVRDLAEFMVRMIRRRRAACTTWLVRVLLTLASATACYRYTPIPLAAVRPTENVQVSLTAEASTRLVKELGTFSARMDLFLARPEVVAVHRRVFSRTRTALATVGAIALFSAIVSTVVQSGDPNVPDGALPPPPPVGARLTLRIPLP